MLLIFIIFCLGLEHAQQLGTEYRGRETRKLKNIGNSLGIMWQISKLPDIMRNDICHHIKDHQVWGINTYLTSCERPPNVIILNIIWYSQSPLQSEPLPWDFYFFKLTQPLTVSMCVTVQCKRERRKTWQKPTPPSLWFRKSIRKSQVWELSRLCPETSKKLYVHEFGSWSSYTVLHCRRLRMYSRGAYQRKTNQAYTVWTFVRMLPPKPKQGDQRWK
jgi:hypothetical protein